MGKPFFFSIGFQCLTHKLSMTECELSINPRCVYLVIIRSVQEEAAAKRRAAAACYGADKVNPPVSNRGVQNLLSTI